MSEKKRIDAICFDQGGTLLYRIPLPDRGRADILKIMEIGGIDGDPESFARELSARDKKYKRWSHEARIEASEEVIWTEWMLPESDRETIELRSGDLTLLFSHSKGERVFREDAAHTIHELFRRGYRLGLITNTVSRTLVPEELGDAGIKEYIEAFSMSSVTGIRKPDPAMFIDVADELGIEPRRCAYIGDAPDRDILGPRQAGYGLSILLLGATVDDINALPEDQRPDLGISSLSELLNYFPPLN